MRTSCQAHDAKSEEAKGPGHSRHGYGLHATSNAPRACVEKDGQK